MYRKMPRFSLPGTTNRKTSQFRQQNKAAHPGQTGQVEGIHNQWSEKIIG
jgi:hypothetical protein